MIADVIDVGEVWLVGVVQVLAASIIFELGGQHTHTHSVD